MNRPYEVIAHPLDGAEVLVKRVKKHAVEVVPLNEAAERLNDSLHYVARIEALESGVRNIVNEKKTYKRFNSQSSYDSAFAAYDRMHDAIDALAALLESEPTAHTCSASCQLPACVLRRRVEELEAQRRWIPVNERLPENGGVYYVIKRGESEPSQSLFDKEFGTFMGPVLYWIDFLLPEPPEDPTP